MTPAQRRSGFTLVELLVVIGVLAILGGILAVLLKLTLETEHAQTVSFDRLLQISRLADEFRDDVAKAENTLANWQDLQADERTLILSLKNQTQIVYQWKDGSLWRSVFAADELSERVVQIDAKDVRIDFVHLVGGEKLVRLRLHRTREGQDLADQALELAAAIGGDQR